MGRTLGALMCLALALVILGAAFVRTLGLGVIVWDGWRASSWVLVQAQVTAADLSQRRSRRSTSYLAEGEYRYTFAGTEHDGRQLGLTSRDSSDWLGEWHMEMAGFLSNARAEGRTVAIYVNPDKPQQSVVDRDIRWGLVAYRIFETVSMLMLGIAVWKMALQPSPKEG